MPVVLSLQSIHVIVNKMSSRNEKDKETSFIYKAARNFKTSTALSENWLRLSNCYITPQTKSKSRILTVFALARPCVTKVKSLLSVRQQPKVFAIVSLLGCQSDIRGTLYEPVLEKTNNLGSDQVWHKPACTVTEDG